MRLYVPGLLTIQSMVAKLCAPTQSHVDVSAPIVLDGQSNVAIANEMTFVARLDDAISASTAITSLQDLHPLHVAVNIDMSGGGMIDREMRRMALSQ